MADDQRPESNDIRETDRSTSANTTLSEFRTPQLDLYDLYLEQQRRLACPGCGEEAFLG